MIPAPDRLRTAVQLLDASTDLIAVKDVAGRFIAANRAFAAALHTEREGLVGRTNHEFFGLQAGTDLSACEHLAILSGEPVEHSVRVSLDGEPRMLDVVCTPWVESGECTGVVVACRLLEEGFPDPSVRDGLHTFASAVGTLAHRFNNALTTVVGLADWHLVAEEHESSLKVDFEKIRTAAGLAEQAAREIQRLTKDTVAGLLTPSPPPRSAATTARPRTPVFAPVAAASGVVLIVDDDADVRSSLTVMTRTLGYRVDAVASGAGALSWLEQGRAALVITDLGMPVMDGAELAGHVNARWPETPVVLLTGWGPAIDPPGGIARLMPKPIRMAELRQCLRELVGAPAA